MKEKRSYKELIYEFVPQETHWGDWCHSPQAYFRGSRDIPGAKYNVGFQIFKGPVFLEREPHFHREEEYLVFIGASFPDVFDFDAEIEFFMGADPDRMERFMITRPTIIRIPPLTWHCPLNFKKVQKPLMFQAALLHGDFGVIKRRESADGYYYVYEGDETRSCVLEKNKRCVFCGRCFQHFNEKETS
ncbi:MAG: hypothetical protein N3B14_09690 [Thermoleophilia bacterium]|nr:hypothetical protein [Thermoleophilia bacterium]